MENLENKQKTSFHKVKLRGAKIMILSQTERWILSNQCCILAALYPDETEHLNLTHEVLASGYEYLYDEFSQHIYADTFSAERSDEVISILEMFTVLERSYNNLADQEGLDDFYLKFHGFDGNNEGEERAFARFFCQKMDRFKGIDADLNSHAPYLGMYRRLLAKYKSVRNVFRERSLSKEQLAEVASVGPHPE